MAYVPVELTKDGKTVIAHTAAEEVQLRWDGWVPIGSPAPDRSQDVVRLGELNTRLDGLALKRLTQIAYDALVTKDPDTLYVIRG